MYSSSSNNSFGVVPIASPTLSLFHDDPYMKVLITDLEQIIKEIQVRHQADKESLLDAIYELKNNQEGPSNY
ncbi:hypothetical protein Tco_0068867 [Tanacetum coccineum]